MGTAKNAKKPAAKSKSAKSNAPAKSPKSKAPTKSAKSKAPTTKSPKSKTPTAKSAKSIAPPSPATSEFPYVHVGHGVSAARKDWHFAVVLRDPIDASVKAALDELSPPEALDTIDAAAGGRAIILGHGSDSLQWVVAAVYPDPGPRADKGESTGEQWKAFNDDVDAYLARIHARFPIAAVIRTVDDEYSTDLSPWHAWSCRELPRFLPFLAGALTGNERWFLEHGCDLWRWWLGELPLDDQKQVIAALGDARAVLAKNGGVPKPAPPKPPRDPEPTLDEQKRVWAQIPADVDPFDAFAPAFAHLSLDGEAWSLTSFRNALLHEDPPAPEHAELLVEITRRALTSPQARWPDTHWRPELVDALLRLGRIDEARRDLARVVLGATSYGDHNWMVLVRFLDALERPDDGDTIFRLAKRYVAAFREQRKLRANKAPPDQTARAAQVLLELAAPVLADVSAYDDEFLGHAAFLFEDLVDEKVAGDALLPDAKRIRAELAARRERRLAEGTAALARGDVLAEPALAVLIEEVQRSLATANPDDVDRLAAAALAHPTMLPKLEALAYYAKDSNVPAALAVYRRIMAAPVPPAELDAGKPRKSWLQSANAALITTHAHKLYDESARLADEVARYAPENPYITHSAACSYAAVHRYDDAFAQAKLAVELGYAHVDKVRVDTDLGPLLERADFKALFKKR